MVCGVSNDHRVPDDAVEILTGRLDTIDQAYITFREQEVGVPDDVDDPPLRRQFAELAEIQLVQAKDLNATAKKGTETSKRVDDLDVRIAAIEERTRAGQRDWFTVRDPAAAAKWVADLQQWFDWVYARRTGAVLPPCWVWHPVVVSDLLALQAHHVWAYKQAQPTAVTQLRREWFGKMSESPVSGLNDCIKDGAHYSAEGSRSVDVSRLQDYLEWWCDGGMEGTPPGL